MIWRRRRAETSWVSRCASTSPVSRASAPGNEGGAHSPEEFEDADGEVGAVADAAGAAAPLEAADDEAEVDADDDCVGSSADASCCAIPSPPADRIKATGFADAEKVRAVGSSWA